MTWQKGDSFAGRESVGSETIDDEFKERLTETSVPGWMGGPVELLLTYGGGICPLVLPYHTIFAVLSYYIINL